LPPNRPPKLPIGNTGAGAGGGGAIGAGAGFFAGFAFFISFLLRAGAARFAFLDFFALVFRFYFAMIDLPIGSTKKLPTTPAAAPHRSLLTLACRGAREYPHIGRRQMVCT
jgi:hypothetical protein